MQIYAGSVNRDNIHMLISILLICQYQFLKGKSSHKLLSEYRELRKRYWRQNLWARGYWVVTSGKVTDEVWNEYIENQRPPDSDDNYTVE